MMDGAQTVQFTSKLSSGDVTDSSVPYTQRFAISRQEVAASGGLFTEQDVIFELPVADLSRTPAEGDVVTDASSVAWRVKSAKKVYYDTVWQLVCVRER